LKILILDFDGTITDAEEEGKPYRLGYLEDLSTLIEVDIQVVLAWAQEFEEHIQNGEQDFGWTFGGRIVAPASVDPYLRIMPVARMILDRARAFKDSKERSLLLDSILYKYNYQKTRTCFRPGAKAFLESFAPGVGLHCHIVTNSHTLPVQRKVEGLGNTDNGSNSMKWLIERVHGSAKKYIIDDDFREVPSETRLPGLKRPILLRRKHYYSVLRRIFEKHSSDWLDVIVLGDIYELDLSLPLQLGATVGLVTNCHTPEYEKSHLSGHARGAVLNTLEDAKSWIESL
jgi:hypothetical protein